jgi:hypothetical protein
MTPQQFLMMLVTPPAGSGAIDTEPLVKHFMVAACNREEALEVFREEMSDHITEQSQIHCNACECRVVPI